MTKEQFVTACCNYVGNAERYSNEQDAHFIMEVRQYDSKLADIFQRSHVARLEAQAHIRSRIEK